MTREHPRTTTTLFYHEVFVIRRVTTAQKLDNVELGGIFHRKEFTGLYLVTIVVPKSWVSL